MLKFSNKKLYKDLYLDNEVELDTLMNNTYKSLIKEIQDSVYQKEWILIKTKRNMIYYLNCFFGKKLNYVMIENFKDFNANLKSDKTIGILNFDLLFGARLPSGVVHDSDGFTTRNTIPFTFNEQVIESYKFLLKTKINGNVPVIAFCESSSEIPAEVYGLFDRIYDGDFDTIPRERIKLLNLVPIELAWVFGYGGCDLEIGAETNIEWLWEIFYYISSFNIYEYYNLIIRTLSLFLDKYQDSKPEISDSLSEKGKIKLKELFIDKINSVRNISRKKSISKEQIKGYKQLIEHIENDIIKPFKGIDDNTFSKDELPTGILFEGPPGNGKTLIASWIATELNAYLEVVNGPSLSSGIVGETPRRIRELFKRARKNAPSVIIFDEFDSIAGSRSGVRNELSVGTTSMSVDAVPQLLAEMDGLNNRNRVLIIATTNLKSSIDEAFLNRPKRISYIKQITPPDEESRYEIVKYYLKEHFIKFTDELISFLTDKTAGFSCDQLREQVRRLKKYLRDKQFDFSEELYPDEIDDFFELHAISSILKPVNEEDIAGFVQIKKTIKEQILDKYNNKNLNEKLLPKGILLEGPPGNGKTLISRWIAHEIKAHIQIVSGPSLKSGIYGRTEAKIRKVFERARMYDKAVIVFDEFDSIANARGGRNDVDNSIVNQLLTEMDGLKSSGRIMIIATTNFKENIDKAFIGRPGRITYNFTIGYPTFEDRKAIINYYIGKMSRACQEQSEDVITILSAISDSYSCDELREMTRQLVIYFIKNLNDPDKQILKIGDIKKWIKYYLIKKWQVNEESYDDVLKLNAYHEAGHFIIWKKLGIQVFKPKYFSIIPAKFTGVINYSSNSNITKQDLINIYIMLLGGMKGEEELNKNNPSLTLQGDISEINNISRKFYEIFGEQINRKVLENESEKIIENNKEELKKYADELVKNFYFEIRD